MDWEEGEGVWRVSEGDWGMDSGLEEGGVGEVTREEGGGGMGM